MATNTTDAAATENTGDQERRDVTDEDVAIRAHEIFMSRGGEHGRDVDDWMEARKELSPEHASDDADDQY